MKTLTKKHLTLWLMLVVTLSPSCLTENENDEVADLSTSVISYQQVAVPDNAIESYILQVFDWSLTGDGNSVFEHITQDDYFGLQAISNSASPLQDLRFQLAKDIQNGVNFLSLDGVFESSQQLTVKLPFSMFNLNSLFLDSGSTINLDDFDFFFQPSDGSAQVAITATLAAEGNSALVNMDATGTIVVRIKTTLCEDGSLADSEGRCLEIDVAEPTLAFKHYMDNGTDDERTFTWDPAGGTSECRIVGGSFTPCTTNSSYRMEAGYWNDNQILEVKVTKDNGRVVYGLLDFRNKGLDKVHFHECNEEITTTTFGNLNNVVNPIPAPNGKHVVCILNDGSVDLTNNTLLISYPDMVIIGRHTGVRPTLLYSGNDSAIKVNTGSTDFILANIKVELNSPPGSNTKGVFFENHDSTAWDNETPSLNTLSNVHIQTATGEASGVYEKGVVVEAGHHLEIFDSILDYAAEGSNANAIFASNAVLHIENSLILRSLKEAIHLTFDQDTGNYITKIKDSVIESSGCTGAVFNTLGIFPGSYFGPPTLIDISNSRIRSTSNGVKIGSDMTVTFNDTVFDRITCSSPTTSAIYDTGGGTTNLTVQGSDNNVCSTGPHQFDNATDLASDVTNINSITFTPGGNATVCPTMPVIP